MLLKLRDGGIENIRTDEDSIRGCETCDYGSKYINTMEITLTKYKVTAVMNQMYEYAVSTDDTLNLFLPNIDQISRMTEDEFIAWFKEWWYNKCDVKIGSDDDNGSRSDGWSYEYGVTFIVKEIEK